MKKKLYYCIYKSFYRKYVECIRGLWQNWICHLAKHQNLQWCFSCHVHGWNQWHKEAVPSGFTLCYTMIHCNLYFKQILAFTKHLKYTLKKVKQHRYQENDVHGVCFWSQLSKSYTTLRDSVQRGWERRLHIIQISPTLTNDESSSFMGVPQLRPRRNTYLHLHRCETSEHILLFLQHIPLPASFFNPDTVAHAILPIISWRGISSCFLKKKQEILM